MPRIRITNLNQIIRRANNLADPRSLFYQAILESNSTDEYFEKVGDIFVIPPTHQKRMGARTEYRYMGANRNWLEEIEEGVDQAHFQPDSECDARQKVLRELYARQGQGKFRRDLLEIYGSRCAITGCSLEHVLEAAHITPYLGPHTNDLSNGLLLRADIHTLWDKGLIAVDPKSRKVWVHEDMKSRDSAYFANVPGILREPDELMHRPSEAALSSHWRYCHEN